MVSGIEKKGTFEWRGENENVRKDGWDVGKSREHAGLDEWWDRREESNGEVGSDVERKSDKTRMKKDGTRET